MGRLSFKELAKANTRENRNVVISKAYNEDGKNIGYVLAEQYVVKEDGKEVNMFLKHSSIGVMTKEGLLNLYKAVTEACEKVGLISSEESEQNTK